MVVFWFLLLKIKMDIKLFTYSATQMSNGPTCILDVVVEDGLGNHQCFDMLSSKSIEYFTWLYARLRGPWCPPLWISSLSPLMVLPLWGFLPTNGLVDGCWSLDALIGNANHGCRLLASTQCLAASWLLVVVCQISLNVLQLHVL
jgi:hypothetical protein